MFLWVRVVQLPPEVQVVHEGRGNQEHQQYQEHPDKKETVFIYVYLFVVVRTRRLYHGYTHS